MANKIKIKISGPVNSGKTTIAQKIVDLLRENGFDVNWVIDSEYNNEYEARKSGLNLLNALESISDKTTITVSEKTIKTDINESLNYRVKKH